MKVLSVEVRKLGLHVLCIEHSQNTPSSAGTWLLKATDEITATAFAVNSAHVITH
jgi:hypothetical protein